MPLSFRFSFLVCLVLGLAACPPALFPVYDDETVVYDAGLVGRWSEKEQAGSEWRFEPRDENSYYLYIMESDDGDTTKLVAHLAEVGNVRYLNMVSEFPEVDNVDSELFLPLNWFFRIERNGDRIDLRVIDHEWIESGLKDGKLKLSYILYNDDYIVITANTKELQAFLIQYEDHPEMWGDIDQTGVLERVIE